MKHSGFRVASALALAAVLALFGTRAYGQGTATSSLSGVVVDAGGGVVPGATVVVKHNDTNVTQEVVTNRAGAFSLPGINPGTYTVTVSLTGFKTSVVKEVKCLPAVQADIKVKLEVGGIEETITVLGTTELVQTHSATIASTINVDQINNLPLATRNAMNFITLLPGVNTTGINRNSNFLGLPSSATAISLDGVNNNENYNKSTEGLFAMVTPRQDAVEAVTVTTATPGSESGGHGAVSINFVTRSGSDQFVGSAYWYHRDPGLNSNYYFNQLRGLPRNNVRINQYGARQGGPIVIPGLYDGHGKSFFFFNYEEFRMPNNFSRTRNILTPDAQAGYFSYGSSRVNLFQLAARYGQTADIDPTIASLLSRIRNAAAAPGVVSSSSDPNELYYDFLSGGNQIEKQPTVRLDENLTSKHRLTGTFTHQLVDRNPDHLNNADVRFPGAPNYRRYVSDRNITSGAFRSVFSASIVNELRGGLKWGPSYFGKAAWEGADTFADENGRALAIDSVSPGSLALTRWYYETATSGRSAWSWNVDETLNWQKGSHSWKFGASYYDGHMWNLGQTVVPTISFGLDSNDPAYSMFTTANFPGASTTQLGYARNLYAILTGRVSQISGQARVDENTGEYVMFGPNAGRLRQQEWGFFAQDLWRIHPQLTINAGLRWDLQLPVTSANGIMAYSTMADLCGVSGVGSQYGCNMYQPGASGGSGVVPGYYLTARGEQGYHTDWKNLGPSIGFAWQPGVRTGIGRTLLGDPEQATFRAGYSISYTREGMNLLYGVYSTAQGTSYTSTRNATNGNLGTLPVLLRNPDQMALASIPTAPAYPLAAQPTNSISIFDPNIQVASGRSVTISFQRPITRDMAFEVRYNRMMGRNTWNQYNLNYGAGNVNITTNNFLNEFVLAQANLQANIAAGRGSTFAYMGPGTNTSPLPTYLAYFNGSSASNDPTKYTSIAGSNPWTNSTFVGRLALQNPNPYSAVNDLQTNATYRARAIAAGLPANFFIVNPAVTNAYIYRSDGSTNYDALQLELRRRLSAGLQFTVNYQLAKSRYSDSVGQQFARVWYQDSGVPHHAIKTTWDYSLPFGRGRRFGTDMNKVLDAVVGGWEFHGDGRVQRAWVDFGNVRLVGMTLAELQAAYSVRYGSDPTTGVPMVYMLPQDIIDNTIRAFNVSATSATGYGSAGAPTGRYLAPANSPSCVQVRAGDCAPLQTLVLAPWWKRFDMSLAKRFPVGGRRNIEIRLDVMNVFNSVNFSTPGYLASSNATVGQVTSGYTDMSNTFDPGGRLGQFVLRFNW